MGLFFWNKPKPTPSLGQSSSSGDPSAHLGQDSGFILSELKSLFKVNITSGNEITINYYSQTDMLELLVNFECFNGSSYPAIISKLSWGLWLGGIAVKTGNADAKFEMPPGAT